MNLLCGKYWEQHNSEVLQEQRQTKTVNHNWPEKLPQKLFTKYSIKRDNASCSPETFLQQTATKHQKERA